MLKAKVYHYNFCDLETFKFTKPKKDENFFKELEIDVGIEGKEGTDRFKLFVCNEGGLVDLLHKTHAVYEYAEVNNVLIVKEFKEDFIIGKVKGRIEKVSGKHWSEITAQLCTFLLYEFSPNTPAYD